MHNALENKLTNFPSAVRVRLPTDPKMISPLVNQILDLDSTRRTQSSRDAHDSSFFQGLFLL